MGWSDTTLRMSRSRVPCGSSRRSVDMDAPFTLLQEADYIQALVEVQEEASNSSFHSTICAVGTECRLHVSAAGMHARLAIALLAALVLVSANARTAPNDGNLEADNPVLPLPAPPLGIDSLDDLPSPPAPERVRLGRWLFYDTRLSADGTVSCATCHVPEWAFSNRTRFAIGVGGHAGVRKTPSFVNTAHAFVRTRFGWDGHATSLEEQSLLPVANPIEMGSTPSRMVGTLSRISGYAPYFEQGFGDRAITPERVASALANYERTRMSGNSA